MLKQLKASIPKPLIYGALDARDRARLALTPRESFDPARLLTRDRINLDSLFQNDALAAAWERDSAAIRQVMPYDAFLGGVNPGDRRALYYLIRSLQPRSVLEVGTHVGASTIHIARALKANPNGGRMTSVDIVDVNDPASGAWKRTGTGTSPRDLAEKLGCAGMVAFESTGALPFLFKTDQSFDFVFLDGDHAARAVYQEVAASLPRLSAGGVILLHDYFPDGRPLFTGAQTLLGPFRGLRRVMKENPQITVRPLGELPWPTKDGSRVTTLALVLGAGAGANGSARGTS